MKKILLFVVFVFSSANIIFAQGEANIWYFGNNAGLDFNSGSPVPIFNGALATNEGCASISNAAGALLFYTDGIRVWNNNHLIMPNGTGLFGDPSATQSGVIVPQPGSPNKYYIFTCAAQAGLQGICYSKVDMSLNGGLGDVTNLNTPLLAQGCEKITAVAHNNGTDYWVIVHGWTDDAYYAYQVTATGVLAPIITNIGSVIGTTGTDESIGYLKASPDGQRLASASSRGVDNCQIFDFNTATGVLSNVITIQYPTWDGPYGVSFSPNNNVLYVSTEGGQSLYQYDLSSGVQSTIIASEYTLSTGSYVFALQLAVDGKIYVSPYGGNLHVINNPNVLGAGCNYVTNAISLSPGAATLGLPNFIQTYLVPPSLNYINTCIGDTTYFSLSDTTSIDSVLWSFNDSVSGINNSSSMLFPSHVFSGEGTYTVSVITFTGSITDTITLDIAITSLPEINLGNDTTLCSGFSTVLNAGAGYSSYLWQNASSNQSITISTPGIYYVTVGNNCGTSADTIQIASFPAFMAVNNQTLCFGDTASLTANGALTYLWNTGSTANSLIVSPATTTSYTVTGTDSNGCTESIVATVNINPLPVSSAGPNDSICSGASIQLNASGGVFYSWTPITGLNNASISNPVSTANSTTIYTVTVTDTNNCTNTDNVTITVFPNPNANFSVSLLCVNNPVQFTDLSTGGGNNLSWNFGDGGTSNQANPLHTYAAEGNYTVSLTATGAGGCNSTISIPVVINPLPIAPDVASNSPVCSGDEVELFTTSTGGLNYLWTGPNSFNSTQQSVNILNATTSMSGVYNLAVTNSATGCVSAASAISIVVNSSPDIPYLEATTQLCYGDTLQLSTTAGAETYLWNGPDAFTSNLQNPSITDVADKNIGVYLLMISNSNGCISQDTIAVFLDCEDITDLFVPNVFTPNNDNENQLFKIVASDLKEIYVEIYDRWGINLYSWDSLQDGWDGKTKKGLEAPDGTYFYILNATTWRGRVISKKGFFSLFR